MKQGGEEMLLDVILCAAIAMLFLVLVWCLIGRLLLPMREGARMVFFLVGRETALERQVRAVNWLRCSGLFDGTLLLVTTDTDETTCALAGALARRFDFVECCTFEDLKDGLRER